MDDLDSAFEAARKRWPEWKARFKGLTLEQQTEEIAKQIYRRVRTHEGAPSWDGLDNQTKDFADDETYTKEPYLAAARFVLNIFS
jgi:hypothetical protein